MVWFCERRFVKVLPTGFSDITHIGRAVSRRDSVDTVLHQRFPGRLNPLGVCHVAKLWP